MLQIYIARHGQDEDNAAGILNGRRDKPLTYIGKQQAELVGEKIRGAGILFNAVYCSPLLRTRQTAQYIVDACTGPTPHVLDELIERDFGIMTGKKHSDIIPLCAPDILQTETVTYFLNPAEAETFPQLTVRGEKILELIQSKHTQGNILLVTHGDVGKMTYAAYYKKPWKEILTQFHFGNSDLLILSPHSPADQSHVFTIEQHNV